MIRRDGRLPPPVATVSLARAAEQPWDAVVAGAGPAGAIAARQLALRGASVLLVDRSAFPRWKVCGCCLNRAALETLEALGLDGLVERLGGIRLERLRLAAGPSHAWLPLPPSVSISRELLDSALIFEAIRAGAEFLPETEAVLLPGNDEIRTVLLRQPGAERSTAGRLAVAADGLGGTFLRLIDGMAARVTPASMIGAGAVLREAPDFYGPGTIFMACARGAYVGAVRLEDGRLGVAAAVDRERLRRAPDLGSLLHRTLDDCRFPRPDGWERLSWRGTPPLTRHRDRTAGHRLFVVGDAAGYVEPFTGEGIAWALQGGILLAPHVQEGLERWTPDLTTGWEERYRRFFRTRERSCRFAARVLRHPLATRTAVALLGQAPWLTAPWMRRISTPDGDIPAAAGGP